MQLTFKTERLILRPSSLDDLEKFMAMDMDPEVMKYFPGVWDGSEAHKSILEECIIGPYEKGLGYWSVFPQNNPSLFLGWVLLHGEKAMQQKQHRLLLHTLSKI